MSKTKYGAFLYLFREKSARMIDDKRTLSTIGCWSRKPSKADQIRHGQNTELLCVRVVGVYKPLKAKP